MEGRGPCGYTIVNMFKVGSYLILLALGTLKQEREGGGRFGCIDVWLI